MTVDRRHCDDAGSVMPGRRSRRGAVIAGAATTIACPAITRWRASATTALNRRKAHVDHGASSRPASQSSPADQCHDIRDRLPSGRPRRRLATRDSARAQSGRRGPSRRPDQDHECAAMFRRCGCDIGRQNRRDDIGRPEARHGRVDPVSSGPCERRGRSRQDRPQPISFAGSWRRGERGLLAGGRACEIDSNPGKSVFATAGAPPARSWRADAQAGRVKSAEGSRRSRQESRPAPAALDLAADVRSQTSSATSRARCGRPPSASTPARSATAGAPADPRRCSICLIRTGVALIGSGAVGVALVSALVFLSFLAFAAESLSSCAPVAPPFPFPFPCCLAVAVEAASADGRSWPGGARTDIPELGRPRRPLRARGVERRGW